MKKLKTIVQIISQNTYIRYSIPVILSIFAIISVCSLYLLHRYYYPPSQIISDNDIAHKILIQTSKGDIEISVDDSARFAASQFTHLVRIGFYDNTRFHRIVPNLLIEAGDPLTRDTKHSEFWGKGGLGTAFPNEIHRDDTMTAGTVAFTGSKEHTYGSQFFILTTDTPWMKGKHTIIGHVSNGMDVVNAIEHATISTDGKPNEDIVIFSVKSI